MLPSIWGDQGQLLRHCLPSGNFCVATTMVATFCILEITGCPVLGLLSGERGPRDF